MEYKLIRRAGKRTITIRVRGDGEVIVSAGERTDIRIIENFVKSKEDFIKNAILRIKRRNALKLPCVTEDKILLNGRYLPLRYIQGRGVSGLKDGEVIIYFLSDKDGALKRWLKRYAEEYFSILYAGIVGNRCPLIVKDVKGYYGQYSKRSGRERITLNMRLIHMDDECIRAIINHEYVHFQGYHGHGKSFYKRLYEIEPHYKDIINRLKHTVNILDI